MRYLSFFILPLLFTHPVAAHINPYRLVFGHGLSQPCMNCVCNSIFTLKDPVYTSQAIAKLAAVRLNVLGGQQAEPSSMRNFLLDENLSENRRIQLAQHLRGIEIWGDPSLQLKTRQPRIAGNILTGVDQIEDYYRQIEAIRAYMRYYLPRDQRHLLRMLETGARANAFSGAILLFMAGDFFLNGSAATTRAAVEAVGLILNDPFSHNLPRWQKDGGQEKFDLALKAYLTLSPEEQKKRWIASSSSYRIPWRSIDALWSRDASDVLPAIREMEFTQTFSPILRVYDRAYNIWEYGADGLARNRFLQLGHIIVDRFVHFNEELGAPELVLVVRSIARTPPNAALPRQAFGSDEYR